MCISPEVAVSLSNISFTYNGEANGQESVLYHNFGLKIGQGGITAVMGASGSGKSTLGKILGGEITISCGQVVWAPDLAPELHHFYIDQDPKKVFFPSQTVRDNLAYAPLRLKEDPESVSTQVETLLSSFGLKESADRYPLFTSGGQQSRLALARVLSWKPRCIILDEYLSSLDVNTKDQVIATLHNLVLRQKVTIILITHSMTEVLRLADRCVVLGNRPVDVIADISIDLPHPRNEDTPGYKDAEDALIGTLRHGLL